MNTVLDLVISSIIGGMVLVTILTLNMNMIETSANQTLNTVIQSELATVTQIVEYDLRKAGYRLTATSDSIKISLMDTSSISIRTDYDNNGVNDSINYRMSTSAISGSQNVRCRYLLRRLNNGNFDTLATTITRFRIYYFGANGNVTTFRSTVKSFRIIINTESQNSFDTTYYGYTGVSWERLFKPKNL